ncbi:MAG: hypothetical protein R2941_10720 [Desulfobacterales bacterium]
MFSLRRWTARNIFIPVLHNYWNLPVFPIYKEFMRHDSLSPDHLKSVQENRLTKIMEYAATHIPYYQSILRGKGFAARDMKNEQAVSLFPVLTKKIIQEHFDELVHPQMTPKDYAVEHSGGSTGQPTKIRRYLQARASVHAATWRANAWMGWEPGDPWMWLWGRLVTTPASWQSRLLNLYKTFATQEAFFNVHGLDEKKLRAFIRTARWFRPKIMEGYTNAFYQLCLLLKQENLIPPPLSGIATTAETLHPEQRSLIEEVLKCRIFNRYASSEVGLIATECEAHAGLHIVMENIFLECVREDGSPASPGEMGKILITDLNNLAMPLIRYDLGDVGILSPEPCKCGRPYPCLKKVIGRQSDVLRLPGNRIVFPDDLAEIFYPIEEVRKFQVIQEEPAKITVLLVLHGKDASERLEPGIRRFLQEAVGQKTEVDLKFVDDIPILPSGKHRICISKL